MGEIERRESTGVNYRIETMSAFSGNEPIETVDRISRLPAIQKAADEFGYTVTVHAKAGETYTVTSRDMETGKQLRLSSKVPVDYVYVSIGWTGLSTTSFWSRVSAIESEMKTK